MGLQAPQLLQQSPTPPAPEHPHPPASQEMFAFAALVTFASVALPKALAHGGVLSYEIGGQMFQGWAVRILLGPAHSSA